MSLEPELVALLKTVSPRTSAGIASPDTKTPYITYQQYGGQVVVSMDSKLGDIENAEIQVNVWADSYTDAKSAIKQIESLLLAAASITATPLGAAAADYDADMKRHSFRQDFSIWAAR